MCKLAFIKREYRVFCYGGPQHGYPLPGRGLWLGTMRRHVAGHQPDFVQTEGLLHLECRPQVAEVYRVEGTAENAYHGCRLKRGFRSGYGRRPARYI